MRNGVLVAAVAVSAGILAPPAEAIIQGAAQEEELVGPNSDAETSDSGDFYQQSMPERVVVDSTWLCRFGWMDSLPTISMSAVCFSRT